MARDNSEKPKLTEQVDIIQDDLLEVYGEEVFNTLLKDHTTQKNIFWATNDYEQLGEAYGYDKPILPELITGENNHIIMPGTQRVCPAVSIASKMATSRNIPKTISITTTKTTSTTSATCTATTSTSSTPLAASAGFQRSGNEKDVKKKITI